MIKFQDARKVITSRMTHCIITVFMCTVADVDIRAADIIVDNAVK